MTDLTDLELVTNNLLFASRVMGRGTDAGIERAISKAEKLLYKNRSEGSGDEDGSFDKDTWEKAMADLATVKEDYRKKGDT